MQNTLKQSFDLHGMALHSGSDVKLTVKPGMKDDGIWFKRTDVVEIDPLIKAKYSNVVDTKLCTEIANSSGVSVRTIEHLMAAFAGTGIHNALVEIDGSELPIFDGSSKIFVEKILATGRLILDAPIRAFKVKEAISVNDGKAWARLEPANNLSIDYEIDYSDTVIGWQNLSLSMKNGSFVRELCDSRTFCRERDISFLHSQGLAKGGSLENAIVLDKDKIRNKGGLRRFDECVRHKMLDAMGDLSLAGGPIMGAFSASCGGHSLTNRLLRAAFSKEGVIESKIIDDSEANDLPGFGLCEADLRHLIQSQN